MYISFFLQKYENQTTVSLEQLRSDLGSGSWAVRLAYNDLFGGVVSGNGVVDIIAGVDGVMYMVNVMPWYHSDPAAWMATICGVLGITVPINYLLENYVLKEGALVWLSEEFTTVDLSFLSFIMFIAVIASMVQLVEMIVEKFAPAHRLLGSTKH